MSEAPTDPQSALAPLRPKWAWGGLPPLRDVWRKAGTSGDAPGTGGLPRHTFAYAFASAGVMVAAVNALNVISDTRDIPDAGLAAPIVWEASSWLSLMCFLWIPWTAWRIAPPMRPSWKWAVHIPALLLFSLGHVAGFIVLRKIAYALAGAHYEFGAFAPHWLYELSKDALGYALFLAGFSLIARLLRGQAPADMRDETFDIRDGAKLARVAFSDILAVASAGNYVEFVLRDGRKLLMRSPLSTIEAEFAPRGFVRTHRSWVVNAGAVTGLKPEGSGDYTVELGGVAAPLSRRFPSALAQLRGE